jgi:hypothetical protein
MHVVCVLRRQPRIPSEKREERKARSWRDSSNRFLDSVDPTNRAPKRGARVRTATWRWDTEREARDTGACAILCAPGVVAPAVVGVHPRHGKHHPRQSAGIMSRCKRQRNGRMRRRPRPGARRNQERFLLLGVHPSKFWSHSMDHDFQYVLTAGGFGE